jgi:alpha-D-xyloside xylohydrolase
MKRNLFLLCVAFMSVTAVKAQREQLLNACPTINSEFTNIGNEFFIASKIIQFDQSTASGTIEWKRHVLVPVNGYSQTDLLYEPFAIHEDPVGEFSTDQINSFNITFINSRTLRIRINTSSNPEKYESSLMLVKEPAKGQMWEKAQKDSTVIYKSENGSIKITFNPWHIDFFDKSGRLLTRTINIADPRSFHNTIPIPFSYVRKVSDHQRHIAATILLSHDEKIFGCGESFTDLDKRGQIVHLWTRDAKGVQNTSMYKPVPFYLSSRGYGIFIHTSAPVICDFGATHVNAQELFVGDNTLDMFFFFGEPKEVVSEYTSITGRSPLLPLSAFGLWTVSAVSDKTKRSDENVVSFVKKMHQNNIPVDVITLGINKHGFRMEFEFPQENYPDPVKFHNDLRKEGVSTSVWQYCYFDPYNKFYKLVIDSGYVITDGNGNLPTEDAIIDLSNPMALKWYQTLLKDLLKKGVGNFMTDFGEGAPLNGIFASGKTGFYEHNLYPLRLNKAVADITQATNGYGLVISRSAWAGSQRYPLHWGGDPESTDEGMVSSLHGGLSLGLCGFTFWDHDIGGFIRHTGGIDESTRELYPRWLALGMFSSVSRIHGENPKEPWAYGDNTVDLFRKTVQARYRLMPYIYAQAAKSSEQGFPMMRTLFFEFPDDPTSWVIDDEYMFGSDMLVAPLVENNRYHRDVYLPPGKWIDYQTGKVYDGEKWHDVQADSIPIVLMIRDGSVIPEMKPAMTTTLLDWKNIDLVPYCVDKKMAIGRIYLPNDNKISELILEQKDGIYQLLSDPSGGKTKWHIAVKHFR